jgi:SAM-dependent methyltransferase
MDGTSQDPICPRCFAALTSRSPCASCGLDFELVGKMVDTVGPQGRGGAAEPVERFYEKNPFPGYAPADDAGSLLDRSRRSAFLDRLDAAIPAAARVLDCGCGTAQLAAFLALAGPRRSVFGVDGCRASLELGEEFRARTGIDNLQLVRGDLFDLRLAEGRFDVVICRGVIHHTPDPDRALQRVARTVAPGGVLLVGFYETRGRLFHRVRRGLARMWGRPIARLDPILRRRDVDAEKKRIWIEDQYRHPLEHILPLPRVVRVLDGLGFEWVRTVPPAPVETSMFAATPRARGSSMALLRLGWMLRGLRDPDAGLVCYVARSGLSATNG